MKSVAKINSKIQSAREAGHNFTMAYFSGYSQMITLSQLYETISLMEHSTGGLAFIIEQMLMLLVFGLSLLGGCRCQSHKTPPPDNLRPVYPVVGKLSRLLSGVMSGWQGFIPDNYEATKKPKSLFRKA